MARSTERRQQAARIPSLATATKAVAAHWRANTIVPLLYVEFHQGGANAGADQQTVFKRAAAASLKACAGTVLRRQDIVAAGRGGDWFVAFLVGRATQPWQRHQLDADLGIAASRLRRLVRAAVSPAATGWDHPVSVRCGWNICEPHSSRELAAALRHAIRGAALVARVEERRATVLAAVSHELRTPLTSVIGFSERLASDGLTPTQRRRALGIIRQEGARLGRLTQGLIDLGAWNADHVRLNRSTQSLRQIALRCKRQINGSDARKVTVVGDVAAWVDAARITEALLNVVDNALRYAPNGSIVRLVLGKTRAGASIAVQDRGPGFSQACLARLGEPFNVGQDGKVGL